MRERMRTAALVVRMPGVFLLAAVTGCSDQATPPAANTTAAAPVAATQPPAMPAAPGDELPPARSPYDVLPEAIRAAMDKPRTGDLEEIIKRRSIRVGVTFNRTHYFVDEGQERGITYEALKAFEDDLNRDLKSGNLKVHVVCLPMSRDQLGDALMSGRIDMIAAMVTVRPELEAVAAFSEPTRTNVSEVVVTGPGAPAIASLDDLAGQEVFVRRPSVYAESLARLNAQLKAKGKPEVVILEAPAVLEDDDILEMVNAG